MKFKKHYSNEDGWCDWHFPVMRGYKMACCDCGLVHDVEFSVHKVLDGDEMDWNGEELSPHDYRVGMRAKRNKRSTGQMRRKRD